MNHDDNQDVLDKNLAAMLSQGKAQVSPAFEQRLLRAVGEQVQHQRRWQTQKRWFLRVSLAATILLAVILVAPHGEESIGTITDIRGLVILRNGERLEAAEGQTSVHPRQWVQTGSGTTADVVLTDQSRLTPHPRTALQLDRAEHGHTVRIEKGAVAIEAHKQPPGQYLKVEAPGTAIKILGTSLKIRVVEKPTGVKQTHVHLYSGSVELASGGISSLLVPGMVGIAEEGRAPVRVSNVLEVNELRRLLQDTRTRAARSKAHANMPTIIDFVSSTVWTVIPLREFDTEGDGAYSLRLKYPAYGVKVYTLDGARAETRAEGRTLHVLLPPQLPTRNETGSAILRIPNATGLVSVNSDHTCEFALPAAASPCVTLLQLCLPKAATVRAVAGEIIETSERLDRQVITLAADSQTLRLYE